MAQVESENILKGKMEICDYARIAEGLFHRFVDLGMPAIKINNRWYSHKQNIDDYFFNISKLPMKDRKKLEDLIGEAGEKQRSQ